MFREEDLVPPPGTRSHAKKKPASYIPRPKNAFIIFRTMYSKWNSMLPRAQDPGNPHAQLAITDHRALSKAAGDAWRRMTEEQKAPYKELADADKAQHKINYPDYKYSP
ncbi:high mobility group box domain-containing protein, partial [Thelephora terrestris]